jgi:hypothetical protein
VADPSRRVSQLRQPWRSFMIWQSASALLPHLAFRYYARLSAIQIRLLLAARDQRRSATWTAMKLSSCSSVEKYASPNGIDGARQVTRFPTSAAPPSTSPFVGADRISKGPDAGDILDSI